MQPRSFEQFEDWGREQERAELHERAEQQIADEQVYRCETEGCAAEQTDVANRCPNCRHVAALEQEMTIAEQLSNGVMCTECGARFVTAQGRPAICRDCGGSEPVVPWYVGGKYLSEPSAAHAARLAYIAKRRRMVARIRRVEADARADTQRAINLAAFLTSTFTITPAGRAALAADASPLTARDSSKAAL